MKLQKSKLQCQIIVARRCITTKSACTEFLVLNCR